MNSTTRDPNLEEPRGPKLQPLIPPAATSDISSIKEDKAAVRDFSIVVGGRVYDFMLRIGLVRLGLPNVQRRIIAFVALAWFWRPRL